MPLQEKMPWSCVFYYCCFVTWSCPTLCNPMDCSTPGLLVHHHLLELAQTHVRWVESVMPSNHLILCCPLLLLASVFPSIRVFSNESVLHIRWPKHWSFSFSISPSSEYLGLISFRIDWFGLLAVQGTGYYLCFYLTLSLPMSLFNLNYYFFQYTFENCKDNILSIKECYIALLSIRSPTSMWYFFFCRKYLYVPYDQLEHLIQSMYF